MSEIEVEEPKTFDEDSIKYIKTFIQQLLGELGYTLSLFDNEKESFVVYKRGEMIDNFYSVGIRCSITLEGEIKFFEIITAGSIEEYSRLYDLAKKDINDVVGQLSELYSDENIIKTCKACGVPKNVVDHLAERLKKEAQE